MIHRYWLMRVVFYLCAAWAIIITDMGSVVHIVVIDYSGLVDIGVIVVRASPIVYAVRLIHVLWTYKYPPA